MKIKISFLILLLISFSFIGFECDFFNKKDSSSGQKRVGLILTPPHILSQVDQALPPIMENGKIPSKVDLSRNMPPPGDQGYQNSCVGFVVAYALKTYQEKIENKWEIVQTNGVIQRNKVFSPSFIYNQINNGNDRGSHYHDAFNLLSRYGCSTLESFPYDPDDYTSLPGRDAEREAEQYRITWSKTISPARINTIKSYIAEGIPVMIGLMINDEFIENEGPVTISRIKAEGELGHAMIVVGYDDDRQVFRLMNSWGTGWRDGGYCWMTYDLFRSHVNEAWITKDMESNDPVKREDVIAVDDNNPVVDELMTDLSLTKIDYNSKDPDHPELGPAMKISGIVDLDKAFGSYAQVIVYLSFEDGEPVMTNNFEFSTVDGQAIGLTPEYSLKSIMTTRRTFTVYIPYSIMELEGGSRRNAKLIASPVLFVDNYDASKGESLTISLR